MNQNIIVSIEGNIGSGKSTLLEKMVETIRSNFQNKTIVFLEEPVKTWETIRDASGNTMLQKFYGDQQKYAFSFQMMAYISRLSILKKAMTTNTNAIIITERSLYTDKLVFAKMLFDNGLIEDVNYQIYIKWFDEFIYECPLYKIIYVQADPTICFERIKKRSRNGESGIPLQYLQDCHTYHESMIQTLDVPCLLLDGNQDIFENKEILPEWFDKIHMFIQ
jgi:deoxyadenosine/deoxycytidine kinase